MTVGSSQDSIHGNKTENVLMVKTSKSVVEENEFPTGVVFSAHARSVGQSVGRSVSRSVGRSVG